MKSSARTLYELVECLRGSVRPDCDWRAVVALASDTLTIGTLADVLLAAPAAIEMPDTVRNLLGEIQTRARQRNARLKSQLLELLPVLNGVGVEPILMRGVARLFSGQGEGSRLLSDIDLLVPAESLDRCTRAMTGLAYGVLRPPGERQVPTVFCRSSDVGMIDLHTQLQPLYLQLGYDALAAHCQSTAFATGQALAPSPTGQLLFTIVHDALHDGDYWRGLVDVRHLVDIHHIASDEVDWAALERFFPRGSPRNALFVQLRSARSRMKVEIPDEYCTGGWIAAQEIRRRIQARFPVLRPIFTLITIAIDPPPAAKGVAGRSGVRAEAAWKTTLRRLEHYLRPVTPGKLLLK